MGFDYKVYFAVWEVKMLKSLMMAGLIGALVAPVYAADMELKAVDKACWLEIFEDNNFDQDDPHVKIDGPAEFANLKNLMGKDWSNDIESVIVGSNTTVKAYKDKDFKGTEIAFAPNQRVPDLAKLDMGNTIESMKIMCGR